MNPLDVIKAKRQHLARLANQQGAAGELRALEATDNWLPRPRGKSLQILLTALRETGIDIKASSFDAIELRIASSRNAQSFRRSCFSSARLPAAAIAA